MKRLTLIIALSLAFLSARAQQPWKFRMENTENEVTLCLDLYEESVDVPGMGMFGPMNGYLAGKGVYGVWMVTSCRIVSDKEALIHLSNDQGSETQPVRLTLTSDSTCLFEQTNGNVIKKAVNRKLVKIPSKLELRATTR
ncbi:MAG: hypothetical protein LUC33_06005 [Prevotellaceae bacterium]|nr:hypothetical protein [Prevotellaceae bacterium]